MATRPVIEPFNCSNPRNWEEYEERLEYFLVAKKIKEEEEKKANLLTLIGEEAYSILRNAIAPAKCKDKSYEELLTALRHQFTPELSSIAQRFVFAQRKQKDGESIADFVVSLRSLSASCKFDAFLDQALRDAFIFGLRDEHMLNKLLTSLKDDSTFKVAVEEALVIENAYKNARSIQGSAPAVNRVEARRDQLQKQKPAFRRATDALKLRENNKEKPTFTRKCYRCSAPDHLANACPHRNKKCKKCGKEGHLGVACKSTVALKGFRNKQVTEYFEDAPCDQEARESPPRINRVSDRGNPGYFVEISINNKPVRFEIDTGAERTILNEETADRLGLELKPSGTKLRHYLGGEIAVKGECCVRSHYLGQSAMLPILAVSGNGSNLLGRDWMRQGVLKLNWNQILGKSSSVKNVASEPENNNLNGILRTYSDVFNEDIGQITGVKATIKIKGGSKPIFCRARTMPFAMKPMVEAELERLEKQGVIIPITHSDWATPIVPVLKSDSKSVRICADFKTTLNKVLIVDQYPLPRQEDLFSALNGGKYFTKLDATQAFLQLELDEDSKQYMVLNTHKGLFQCQRLQYGLASGPAVFQMAMDKMLQGLSGVICFIDDVLVVGKNSEEHLQNLNKVLQRFRERGVRLKQSKCKFMQTSVTFLGYRMDEDGIHPTEDKIRAIQEAPRPRNVSELRAWIGLVNYYGKFIQNLATLMHPFYVRLRKEKEFDWPAECEAAFKQVKGQLTSSQVLTHYDPSKKLKLECDASPYGLGAVISHETKTGDRPIAYASRTLSAAEKNYAQIEKEALAIIFGLKKFHEYLFGRTFILVTDHKPLLAIFDPKRQVPPVAASRLQRWAMFLGAHSYEIKFRPTDKHCNADGLSRLPEQADATIETETDRVQQVIVSRLPVQASIIATETLKDPVLKQVLLLCKQGWQESSADVSTELKPYYDKRHELGIVSGVLLLGMRVVIPTELRRLVLEELHEGHPGIVLTKSRARMHCWWPRIDQDIEDSVSNCRGCQLQRSSAPEAPLSPLTWPTTPWTRVHVDFLGPYRSWMFLVVVDATSKFPEVIPMKNATSDNTVRCLREIFARFGLPRVLHSDNGSPFTSYQFKDFLQQNGIRHSLSSPGHPRSNGLAENMVKQVKKALKASNDPDMLKQLSNFLLRARTTPHSTTGKTPSEMLFGRTVRTRLSLLFPDAESKVLCSQDRQKDLHDGKQSALVEFSVGERVLTHDLRRGKDKWAVGTIIKRTAPLTYSVRVGDLFWKRHVDQLRKTGQRMQETVEPKLLWDTGTRKPDQRVDLQIQPRLVEVQTEPVVKAHVTPRQEPPGYKLRDRTLLKPPTRFIPGKGGV